LNAGRIKCYNSKDLLPSVSRFLAFTGGKSEGVANGGNVKSTHPPF
jgi:hypothetical protein